MTIPGFVSVNGRRHVRDKSSLSPCVGAPPTQDSSCGDTRGILGVQQAQSGSPAEAEGLHYLEWNCFFFLMSALFFVT